jgi:hypothetical protein
MTYLSIGRSSEGKMWHVFVSDQVGSPITYHSFNHSINILLLLQHITLFHVIFFFLFDFKGFFFLFHFFVSLVLSFAVYFKQYWLYYFFYMCFHYPFMFVFSMILVCFSMYTWIYVVIVNPFKLQRNLISSNFFFFILFRITRHVHKFVMQAFFFIIFFSSLLLNFFFFFVFYCFGWH